MDAPSRRLSRTHSKLSAEAFTAVEHGGVTGGVTGHSFDLMALGSNAVLGKNEKPLLHFTPHPSPCSAGVNLFCQALTRIIEISNPYMFPPFGLIGPVLTLLLPFRIPFTIVVPEFIPPPYWWPELIARSTHTLCLGKRGDKRVLLSPSKFGCLSSDYLGVSSCSLLTVGTLFRRFCSLCYRLCLEFPGYLLLQWRAQSATIQMMKRSHFRQCGYRRNLIQEEPFKKRLTLTTETSL